ncbi:probable pectinesterase/pectinesterase inhibitor 61 [Chenopodium quinoa]|uniref:probable pectinesterase/pectinesterase inhibitor 61 n=1 Tax=Chenopodium quinoa TaxID=63459 RepID=UPI000B77685E|nr:probable pectinesterase/pectinesterase inhibitor 61 [Chenopodium quinoa]
MATVCSNQDTCTEGFEEAGGAVKHQTAQIIQELWQIVSNHLDLSSMIINCDVVSGRRLMGLEPTNMDHKNLGDPKWISKKDKKLLGSHLANIQPNVTVSHHGIGPNVTVRSIKEAIEMAPKNSSIPFIIHVKAGRYQEANLTVGKSKTNLWFIGAGKGKTIITGVTGAGFVARGITFESTAGPQNHQAVALLVKSEHSVFYECEMKGYQDTLYIHSNRQFYRNCDIYGTIDFIFGKAQAVFQNCTIYTRKPMEQQTNTIIAHKRPCSNICAGISIHECQIRAAPDLEPVKSNYTTYLGRPWNEGATTVYMLSYIGDHIDPQGWIPWNSTTTLDDVFYGEFQNYGPGANISQRVISPGVHANMSVVEAARFTVDRFVDGSSWIGHTKVPFEAGLGY